MLRIRRQCNGPLLLITSDCPLSMFVLTIQLCRDELLNTEYLFYWLWESGCQVGRPTTTMNEEKDYSKFLHSVIRMCTTS